MFGALNINAINFDAELGRAEKKIEKGMQGLLTQPVLSRRGLENLRRAKTSLNCYILGGIIPVISERNARFMNSEVNGIDVEEALIQRYVGLNREEVGKSGSGGIRGNRESDSAFGRRILRDHSF